MEGNGVSKHEFEKLEHSVDNVETLLTEVHQAIVGNPTSKDGGIAQRLTDAEEELIKIKDDIIAIKQTQLKQETYRIIMWSCIGAVIMSIFLYVINQVLK